jgi:hypothetical protein
MTCGNAYKKKGMIKYTINFDGMYGSCAKTHSEESYGNESLALPENVLSHFKQTEDHACVYIFDRAQSSADSFGRMKAEKGLLFVGRLMENRKLKVVKSFDLTFKKFGGGELKQDALVRLYTKKEMIGKKGKPVRVQVLTEEVYRVIRFRPENGKEDILLITNILNLQEEYKSNCKPSSWPLWSFKPVVT